MRADRTADWISVTDALSIILAHAAPLQAESIALDDALGRTLAGDIVSPIDHPPWDNSAMDGFAVRAADVRGATAHKPVLLRVTEEVPAGGFAAGSVGPGEAIRIMTGAPMPAGADCVVRIEHTEPLDDGRVRIVDGSDAGRNVRPQAEDVAAGERLFESGRTLRPGEIGVLASIGCARVPVHRRPRVALLATGDELTGIDGFGEVLAGRRIVNSNTHALSASARGCGAVPVDLGIARDDLDDVCERVRSGLDCDILVTTAGASVGDHDVVKDALEAMGLRVAFWRVTMRPGSPVSYGTLERDGAPPLPVFGLPGNPVSALVTFEVLVRPALRRMLGRTDVHPRTLTVRAGERMKSTPVLTHYLRVRLAAGKDGVPVATLTGGQGSGILTSVARADALLVVPLGRAVIEPGEPATALLLPPMDEGRRDIGYDPGAPADQD